MRQVAEELRYEGATLEQVHAMLADPAFREKVCEHQHVSRHTVRIQKDGEGMTAEINQFQVARGLPGYARKVVGDEIHIVQTEEWTAPAKGHIHMVIPGRPAEIAGTALLTEDPDGTTETVNLTVKVHLPLVGGKIESVVADLLSRAFRAEHEAGVEWLAGDR